MKTRIPYLVLPLFVFSLIAGIWGGWIRMGWSLNFSSTASYHGLLMVGGFLGGVISLERTITMKFKGWLVFPFFCGLSMICYLTGQEEIAPWMLLTASGGLIIFYGRQMLVHQEKYWYLLFIGAVFWFIGNLKFLQTDFVPAAVNWWIGFILLTILGERLELTRFVPVPKAAGVVMWILFALVFISFFIPFHASGLMFYGISLLFLTLWFLRFDIARLSSRKSGYFRYTGMSMLTAYGWLLVHVLLVLFFNNHPFFYDLYLHSFFLGFGFSMIWAHAPIILPGILRISKTPFHPILWLFWFIFQLTLAARILFTMMENFPIRKLMGMVNGIAVLLMLIAVVLVVFFRNFSFETRY